MCRTVPLRTASKYAEERKQRLPVARIGAAGIVLLCCFNSFGYYQGGQPPLHSNARANVTASDRSELLNANAPTTSETFSAVVDIISIGSLTKPALQNAQERTFGSHSAVRTFFRLTEVDDADADCATHLTDDQIQQVVQFCHLPAFDGESMVRSDIRHKIFRPKEHAGWLCAQKRPLDGLYKVLQQYRDNGVDSLPEYLFIIDDDTYLNMDSLLDLLWTNFPPSEPHVKAGCVYDFLRRSGFAFPYGGFGSFLSRKSIERLLQPIDCRYGHDEDAFGSLACARLNDNFMGEQAFFHNGMSLSDLMYAYAAQQPFAHVANWTVGAGFCFHSDHALAYFFNYYHVAATDESLATTYPGHMDHIRRSFSYNAVTTIQVRSARGECDYIKDKCTNANNVCHYIEPAQMDALYLDVGLRQSVDTSTDMVSGLQRIESMLAAAEAEAEET